MRISGCTAMITISERIMSVFTLSILGFQPQHQQHPDPWVQQVPDQGYGQSWGASGRGGGGGTWQGYGGQTYGSYGR